MNVWSILSLVAAFIYLVGFAALIYCAKRAPEGYEDADGFRLGVEPAVTPWRSPAGDPAELENESTSLADAA
jgi:hypothetical protein